MKTNQDYHACKCGYQKKHCRCPGVSKSTETAGYVTISMTDLCRMYAVAYHEGHHDTVEAQYTDVFPVDMDTYHEETVREFLDER